MTWLCSKKHGYTLIELIVVLLLISIALGLTLMSVAKGINHGSLKETTKELSSVMRYAKNKAQILGTDMTVMINLDEKYYTFDGKKKELSDKFYIKVNDPLKGEINIGKWEAVFYLEGGSSGGEVVLSDGQNTYNITIDPLVGSVINKVE
ncbi:MAG: prepilin-type N-terminal cleavage/methylation domain-containing protein [Candidatus Magnetoovum sp. WYHC-5]|nr:prepilin-type N-terminal cleavage/methylation domain-containing protein [Candidatus Magnetoovum sp. WYHC-5]